MEYENDYEQSYKAWLGFKESSNNSYRYVVSGATWAGAAWETTITVNNGEVTGRDFRYTVFNDIRMPADGWDLATAQQVVDTLMAHSVHLEGTITAEEFLKKLSWIESKQDLNNTTDSPAAATLTLDQVYELAKNDWLRRLDNAKASFEAKNNGIISSCGYWEDGCMDDCFRGIRITLVEAL